MPFLNRRAGRREIQERTRSPATEQPSKLLKERWVPSYSHNHESFIRRVSSVCTTRPKSKTGGPSYEAYTSAPQSPRRDRTRGCPRSREGTPRRGHRPYSVKEAPGAHIT